MKKKIILAILLISPFLATGASAGTNKKTGSETPPVAASKGKTVNKKNKKRFDITAYGAVADWKTLNSKAIQATIDQCAQYGGGTVVLPK